MPNQPEGQPTNYRKNQARQERQLVGLVSGVLLVVGTGLIGLIWGLQAALVGGACLFGGAASIVVLWLGLSLAQRWLED